MSAAAVIPSPLLSALVELGYGGAAEINPIEGERPLNFAVASAARLAADLIDLGADINAPCDFDGRTPLMYATFNASSSLSMVELLLRAGADCDVIDRHGYSALGLALAHQNGAMSARLLKAGACVHNCFPSSVLDTPLFCAAKGSVEALPLLARAGVDMHAVDHHGRGVLHLLGAQDALATHQPGKSIRILDELYRHGVDIDQRDELGNTPLHLASTTNALLCQWLIRRGACCNARNKAGISPLMLASMEQAPIARLLIAHGAQVSSRSNRGLDALMSACAFPSSLFERNLMAHHRMAGSLVNQLPEDALLNSSHRAPALEPLRFCKTTIPTKLACPTLVKELLVLGADPHRRARDGSTSLMLAARYQPENLSLLLEQDVEVSERDKSGWTALMCAAASTRADLAVAVLLAGGADPSEAFEKPEVRRRFERHPHALSLLQAALLVRETPTPTAPQETSRARL